MGTIKETYVSFEIANLLNEKGFDEPCRARYDNNGSFHYEKYPIDASGAEMHNSILCPTIQMVMMWLREVHNIFICIIPSEVGAGVMDYTYVLYRIDAKNFHFKDLGIQGRANSISELSHKETCEAAIKYCLEKKLIF